LGQLLFLLDFGIFIPICIGLLKWPSLTIEFRIFLIYLIIAAASQLTSYLELDFISKILIQYFSSFIVISLIMRMIVKLLETNLQRYFTFYTIVLFLIFCLDYVGQWSKLVKFPFAYIFSNLIFVILSIRYIAKEFALSLFNKEIIARLLIVIPLATMYILFDFLQLVYLFLYRDDTKLLMQEAYHLFWVYIVFCYVLYSFALLWAPRKETYI
jgi:hypothetical protein